LLHIKLNVNLWYAMRTLPGFIKFKKIR